MFLVKNIFRVTGAIFVYFRYTKNSFKTGSLPTEWKMANIVPVFKKGDKACIENYRPISLTSIVSKVFEKYIRDELLTHCNELIHDTQHGFLPHKSCTSQLLPFSHDISLGFFFFY